MHKESLPLQRIRRLVRSEWFWLLAITALAGVLRLYALDRLPSGLYRDEAYNGLDALAVLRGARPIFFEANNGREPFFIYLVALSVSVLGRSPWAIRVVAAILGTLTVPAAYAMTRELLGRREALLTALVTALTFWHLNLSRLGLRAVSLPLFIALCLWWFARALHRGKWYDYAISGLCLGLSLYTYIAARFLPVVILMLSAVWIARRQSINHRGLALLLSMALLVAAPLLIYFAQHGTEFLARSAQVSVLNPTINHGDLLGTLSRHLLKTLGMFNWRGDFIPRHNLPLRPVFDPVMGTFFLLGVAFSASRSGRKPEYALLLLYTLIMLGPTVLAEDAPHFLRSVGILPIVFVFPAVGWLATWDMLKFRAPKALVGLVLALLMAWSGYATIRDYFGRHVVSETTYYHFESGVTELSASINAYLDTGWYPETELHGTQPQVTSQRHVYLDKRLWNDWPSLRYLVPESSHLTLLGPNVPTPGNENQVRIVLWPFEERSQYLTLLPHTSIISVQEGPRQEGDLETEAKLLCLTYEAQPMDDIPSNLQVRQEKGITLLGYALQATDQGTRLRLFWHAEASQDTDYSVFVHLQGNGQVIQSDSYPAQGYYPTHLWRAGDIIVDDHVLQAQLSTDAAYTLDLGMYQLQSMQRLRVIGGGQPDVQLNPDSVTINVP